MRGLRGLPDWFDFEIRTFHVTRALLGHVRGAIAGSNQARGGETRRGIYVWYNGSYRDGAVYDSTHNSLTVGFEHLTTTAQKALVVHEGVHAAADVRYANWMHVQTSEAAAHIAQCIIEMSYHGRDADPPTHSDPNRTVVFARAWEVAQILHDRQRPSWGQYQTVWDAVPGVQSYRDYGLRASMDYRGVPGVSREFDETAIP